MAARTGETASDTRAHEAEEKISVWQQMGPSQLRPGDKHVPGNGGPMRWFFSSIWLAYLVSPVSQLFQHPHGAHAHAVPQHGVLWIAGGLAITVAFCAIYAPIVINSDRWPRVARYGLGALIVLASLACVVYGQDWTPLWIYVSAAGGMVLAASLNRQRAMLGVLAITGLYAIFSWISHLDLASFFAVGLPVLIIGLAMIGFRMQIVLMRELASARSTVAKLAVNEERLRLARDMHDLTGQSLSMITLKSDLAAKRLTKLPPSAERDAVLGELGDIARVSRQTLHDIREAVSGYRRPTLAIEVITARNALESAGIGLDDDPRLTLRSGLLDPDAEAVLAWCLREAVTNVIRHSGAKNCLIRLAERGEVLSLEVTDDGRGFAETRPAAPQDGNGQPGTGEEETHGTGLRGMTERLSAAGGALSLGSADPSGPGPAGHGFRLTATVPQNLAVTADDTCSL
jgi:two-component system, NarL family, sensor histidine kinase DesK